MKLEEDDGELENQITNMKLYLGYVPKDISYNFSVLLDNPSIFKYQVIDYGCEGRSQTYVFVIVDLQDNVLRDHRMQLNNVNLSKNKKSQDSKRPNSKSKSRGLTFSSSQQENHSQACKPRKSIHDHLESIKSYKLPYVPGMARLVKTSLYELHQNWNLNV